MTRLTRPTLLLLFTVILLAIPDLSRGSGAGENRGDPSPATQRFLGASNRLGTECNRPAADMPPAPDGCPDWTPIAPPPTLTPPPCLTIWVSRSYWDFGTGVALHIRIDHPELSTTASTYTKLSKLIQPGEQWELVDADWEVSCGKDEAPLVWALFEVLNKGEWGAFDIYTSPLPEGYLAVLRELASLRNFVYLAPIFGPQGIGLRTESDRLEP